MSRHLLIDNYDSFTFNLAACLRKYNQEVLVVRNDKINADEVKLINPDSIIISPGPFGPRESGNCLEILNEFYHKLPFLGICLGHQILGYFFKSEIITYNPPFHGKISEIFHNKEDLFNELPNPTKACRYHSMIIDQKTISGKLIVTSWLKDGTIMGIKHKSLPLFGLQFHPESIASLDGEKMLNNYIKIVQNECNKKINNKA